METRLRFVRSAGAHVITTPVYKKPASTELTGGAGFSYEDTIVAYYLSSLLRRERAAGQSGFVVSVAVQRQGHGNPMDDLVVEFDDVGTRRLLSLQIKSSVTISGAASNDDFQGILTSAAKTQALPSFAKRADLCGFIVEQVTADTFRSLHRLIDWAKASEESKDFGMRFELGGTAAAAEKKLRDGLLAVIGAADLDGEVDYYRHFVALHLEGFGEGELLRSEVLNRLQELVSTNEDGADVLLFDRLCRIVREGAANAQKWTRSSLLSQLRGAVRLKVIPSFDDDIKRLVNSSLEVLNDISEEVDGFQVDRAAIQSDIIAKLERHRVVSIVGLPGCGKSAVLKRFVKMASLSGPVVLMNDRILGTGWSTFATGLGLSSTNLTELLEEIGSSGTAILFIDGIDRIRPDQQGVVKDLIDAIANGPSLSMWKVLISYREQSLEAFRTWFPPDIYAASGIGEVTVGPFSDSEAEDLAKAKPILRRLLFGTEAVRYVARRPFFAAVLARSIPDGSEPQNEVDLIAAWWDRAGHDAVAQSVHQRQRALIDIAESGVRNLGKNIRTRDLNEATHAQISSLKVDWIIRDGRGGATVSFSHDIFFEWAFFRLLIDLGGDWTQALRAAGEPPLLGRVVGLLAQNAMADDGLWTAGYRSLEGKGLRKQWEREWLTAPPFSPSFKMVQPEYIALLKFDEFALLEKVLVWFQAQHTMPSPIVLANNSTAVEGRDLLAIADMLGWPVDFKAWGRLIDWIIDFADDIPTRLLPKVLEVFSVWQNACADFRNRRSEAVLKLADAWLSALEHGKLRDGPDEDADEEWSDRGHGSHLGRSIRAILMRSARSYPDFARDIFKRAIENPDMRRALYSDLVVFSPIMSEVDPDVLADLAEAEIMLELPEDKLQRETEERDARRQRMDALRAIPEDARTERQQEALQSGFFHMGGDLQSDDIGLQQSHSYYHPPSALHEPFKSLFANKPDVGLRLVRNLANHATTGWRQIRALDRRNQGTPVPVSVQFPWGSQEFWGSWHTFSWGLGMLCPNSLECAFLALNHWAFKQLESGCSASDVIKDVVEGHQCYGTLGVALRLALETWELSETTLAIASCQRLWAHDQARHNQEATRDIDIFGMDFLTRLTGEKAVAKEFLDGRKYRGREIRHLAMQFVFSPNDALRERFQTLLTKFPAALPYDLEEEKANDGLTRYLTKQAQQWASLADQTNYSQVPLENDVVAVAYDPKQALTAEEQARLEENTTSMRGYSVVTWAVQSLQANRIENGWSLDQAVAHAKSVDHVTAFERRLDDSASPQSVIASVAACVVRFADRHAADRAWAWEMLSRVDGMAEADNTFGQSKIPWHPSIRLIVALHHDRRSAEPREDSVRRLLHLALHPLNDVSGLAFDALFADGDEHVRWIAGRLAVHLCTVFRGEFRGGGWDQAPNSHHREASLSSAISELYTGLAETMPSLPPAWEQTRIAKEGRDPESRLLISTEK